MERTYKLNVTSDTTMIDVQSVNADEVARIAQLAGIIEPHTQTADIASSPIGAPVDPEMSADDQAMQAVDAGPIQEPMDGQANADVMHGLNDLRKNAGLPTKAAEPASDDVTTGIAENNVDDDDDYDDFDDDDFADPGGRSSLRAGIRNRPCPTCGYPNRLTARDVELGYQCDRCADARERGGEIDYYDPTMDENVELEEDVAEYDYGHRKFKDEGEEIDEPEYIWQAVENPQRIKGSAGDNGLIQELHNKLINDYTKYLEETERENESGAMSPLSDPTKPSFDKDPLHDEEPVDDGSHSPMSTIVRQHAFK